MKRLVTVATLGAMLFSLPAAAMGPVTFDRAWNTQRLSLFSANSYGFNGQTLSVISDGSVSLAWRALPQSFWNARAASWGWRVEESVPATDLARKGGDDRNLAMYFVFLPEDEAERARGRSIRSLLDNDAARVLVYVWGGDSERGAALDSPYLGPRGKTIVLRAAGTGSARERVSLANDYARAFGSDATSLVGLAVSADSDDTDSRVRAAVANLELR